MTSSPFLLSTFFIGALLGAAPEGNDLHSTADELRTAYRAIFAHPISLVGRLAVRSRDKLVPLDAPFHEGDEIQFEISANRAGWVYIFHRGRAGKTELLWPDPKHPADNLLLSRVPRVLPDDGALVFDNGVGEETFLVVISPTPDASPSSREHRPKKPPAVSHPANSPTGLVTSPEGEGEQIYIRAPAKHAQDIRADLQAGARGVTFRPRDEDQYVYFAPDSKGGKRWAIAKFQLQHAAEATNAEPPH